MNGMATQKKQEAPLLPVYLIVGEDALKRDTVMKRLRARLSSMGDLSFNADEFDGETPMFGDIIVCPSVVEGQAGGFGNSAADEMRLLLVHGALHLMGYDHEVAEEAEEMEALERAYLAAFVGVPIEELNVGPTVDHRAEGSQAAFPSTDASRC